MTPNCLPLAPNGTSTCLVMEVKPFVISVTNESPFTKPLPVQSKDIFISKPSDSFTTDLFKRTLLIEILFVANWLGDIAETFFTTSAVVGWAIAALFLSFVVAEVSVLLFEVASPAVLAGVVVVSDVLSGVALVFGCVSFFADVVASAVDSVAAAVDAASLPLLGAASLPLLGAAGLPLLGAAGLPLLGAAGLSLLGDDNATSLSEISVPVLPLGFALVSVWLPVPVVPVCVTSAALTVVAPPNINPPKTTLPTINEAAPPPFFFFLIEYFNFLFRLFLDTTSLIPLFNIWYLIKNNNQFYSSNLILFFLYFYFSKNKANLKSSYQLPLSKFTFSCDFFNQLHFIKCKIKFQYIFSKIFIRLYKLLPSPLIFLV